jgi:hypothetical protein
MYCEIHDDEISARAGAKEISELVELFHGLANGSQPSLAAFGPERLVAYSDDLAILRPDGEHFIYSHYGANVAKIAGINRKGQHTGELQGEVADFFLTCYRRARESGRPLHTLHCSLDQDDSHLWERLLLPMIDDEGNDVLVVFNRSQEAHFAADLADTPARVHLGAKASKLYDVPQVGLVPC